MFMIKCSIACFAAAAVLAGTANAQNVRILGRSEIIAGGGFASQWPSSGFEATFTGGTLTATIYDWGSNWLNVEIDGVVTKLELSEGTNAYTLFQGEAGPHKIRVTRRTGTDVGVTRFESIEAAGLTPTTAPDRRILVIGDSYASGYGVEGPNEKCTSTHAIQNSDLAFPALTARAFGADVHVVAADGRGLIRNFAGDGPTMATLAWQTLADGNTAWAALAWEPQVVVLNLGTNDFTESDPGAAFDDAYVYTLRRLRTAYPKATIIGTIGGSLWGKRYTAAKTSISDAAAFLNKEGDANVKFVEFKLTAGEGRYGCDYHPGVRGQAEMAAALETEIAATLGWNRSTAPVVAP